jgi:tetratricopeptide (TPR) repeat protein
LLWLVGLCATACGQDAAQLSQQYQAYYTAGRYGEAESVAKQRLALAEQTRGTESVDYAFALNDLAVVMMYQGRYAEAEPLYKQSLAVRRKVFGTEHLQVATGLHNLGILYSSQGRYADAEKCYQQALAMIDSLVGPDHAESASTLNNLAVLYKRQRRFADAEPLYRRALAIFERTHGPDDPDVASSLMNLANVYVNLDRLNEAEPLYRRSMAIKVRLLGPDHPDIADILYNMADAYDHRGRSAQAEPWADRVIAIRDLAGVSPGEQFNAYELRSRIRQHLGRRDEAMADLSHALDLAEKQRLRASGDEVDRAAFFASFLAAFERMMVLQSELGNMDGVLAAIDRARARSLADQLQRSGIDPLAGIRTDQVAQLRQRQTDNQTRLAELDRQLRTLGRRREISLEQQRLHRTELLADLAKAQDEAAEIYRDVQMLSPAYRLITAENQKPLSLGALQSWVDANEELLLCYCVGQEGIFVLVVPAKEKPRLVRLAPDAEMTAKLGVDTRNPISPQLPEALRAEVLEVLMILSDTENSARVPKRLARLWRFLVPEPEREALTSGRFKRLTIVPDGILALLPFEALVVETETRPKYLLDAGPPILYGPSISTLYNLAQRAIHPSANRRPVLTVGDPLYEVADAKIASSGTNSEEGTASSSRYLPLGGHLRRLVNSGIESGWVAEAFESNGIAADRLLKEGATEAAVRLNLPGRRIVHLACHGLVDPGHGNLFAALALTPGAEAASDTANDGFLTLAETYDLNLSGCELAILSACQTNYGPQQKGEGMWALSRGFLVAGSRRVVASNWLVDDEAAATLIYWFCGFLAEVEKQGKSPDYAAALQRAKRAIRQQEKWKSPYYWGTFVLVGPN